MGASASMCTKNRKISRSFYRFFTTQGEQPMSGAHIIVTYLTLVSLGSPPGIRRLISLHSLPSSA